MAQSHIIEIAQEVAKKYNPENLSPFPFEKLQEKENIEIYLVDLGQDVSGAIEWDKDTQKFEIFIDENKPQTRQYFTIAHEIGHYFLHKELIKKEEVLVDEESTLDTGKILYRKNFIQSVEIEKEANRFAAKLIMPADLVKKAWNSLHNVQECATIFHVSLSAMSHRLEELGLV